MDEPPDLGLLFHRLNNQLGIILANAELLEAKAADEMARARAAQVVASVLDAMATAREIRLRARRPLVDLTVVPTYLARRDIVNYLPISSHYGQLFDRLGPQIPAVFTPAAHHAKLLTQLRTSHRLHEARSDSLFRSLLRWYRRCAWLTSRRGCHRRR